MAVFLLLGTDHAIGGMKFASLLQSWPSPDPRSPHRAEVRIYNATPNVVAQDSGAGLGAAGGTIWEGGEGGAGVRTEACKVEVRVAIPGQVGKPLNCVILIICAARLLGSGHVNQPCAWHRVCFTLRRIASLGFPSECQRAPCLGMKVPATPTVENNRPLSLHLFFYMWAPMSQ